MELAREDFEFLSEILHRTCGIRLRDGKECLVKARLQSRLRSLGIWTFREYLARIEDADFRTAEMSEMVDALTTNKTSFFREDRHFDFLREYLRARSDEDRSLRIWSAGCSSGEEPYSIAITILERDPAAARHDARVLATDISSRVLAEARAALYPEEAVSGLPRAIRDLYLKREGGEGRIAYRVAPSVRELVRFARLNLVGPWPMHGPFHLIFCRNVMIYFDRSTQETLIRRFRDILRPGGYLFLGHAESLTGSAEGLTYVAPAVYRR